MAKGGLDYAQFRGLLSRVERAARDSGRFQRELLEELGNRAIRRAKERTPTVTGNLRRNWRVLAVKRVGDGFEIEVCNNTEYASYVEYGHRQQPGRYVPAIGKRLKEPWVEGKHMLTISMKEINESMPKLTAKRAEQFLRRMMEEK